MTIRTQTPISAPPHRRRRARHAGAGALAVLSWATASMAGVPAAPGPRAAPAEVRFEPDDPDVTLLTLRRVEPVVAWGPDGGWGWGGYGWGYRRHRWWGYGPGFVRSYTAVCTGRCSARFMPGEYEFALEKSDRVVPTPPVVITQPSTLHAEYVDRSGLRVAGVVIGVTGVIAGTVMMFTAVDRESVCDPGYCYYQRHVEGPLFAVGLGVFLGSAIAGSILAWQPDTARISVSPLHVSSLGSREASRAAARILPEGAAVNLRF